MSLKELLPRRLPTIKLYWNPFEWEWRTVSFEHCVIRHRGPLTIRTYRAWTAAGANVCPSCGELAVARIGDSWSSALCTYCGAPDQIKENE